MKLPPLGTKPYRRQLKLTPDERKAKLTTIENDKCDCGNCAIGRAFELSFLKSVMERKNELPI